MEAKEPKELIKGPKKCCDIGTVLLTNNNYSDAIVYFQEAIQQDHKFLIPYLFKAYCHLRQKDYQFAIYTLIDMYDHLIRLKITEDNMLLHIHLLFGHVFQATNNLELAAGAFNKAKEFYSRLIIPNHNGIDIKKAAIVYYHYLSSNAMLLIHNREHINCDIASPVKNNNSQETLDVDYFKLLRKLQGVPELDQPQPSQKEKPPISRASSLRNVFTLSPKTAAVSTTVPIQPDPTSARQSSDKSSFFKKTLSSLGLSNKITAPKDPPHTVAPLKPPSSSNNHSP